MSNVFKGKGFLGFILISLSLVTVFLFSPNNAWADVDKIELTDDLAVQIAQEFADSVNNESDVEATNPVKFYNENGQAIGYIVTYETINNDPSGYVVLDNSDPSLFAEWTFEEGATSPIKLLADNATGINSLNNNQTTKIIKSAPFTYAITSLQSNTAVDMYGNDISNELNFNSLSASPGDSSWDDIFIDGYSSAYTMTAFEHIPGELICFPESQIEQMTGKYGCVVTAMLNCLPFYYSGFNWSNWASDYNALWSLSNTQVDYTSNGIQYGSTYFNQIGPAFSSYLKQKGVTVNYSNMPDPTWSFFKSTIDRNDMGVYCVGIMQNGSRVGHAMAVEGYSILKLSSGISEDIYTLLVADGWSQARFVNIYFTRYTDTYDVSFS